ncbi:cupin domain-containing protein [Pseudomonas sp. ZM23]|uniref:Cupin domain-containing protein n=1 Tax=Pseudomonas triclosanedens TaxID=2961893 RepID=A0ABY6ZUY1_9PSED|nr:cupin domain-containing protein [Pseudomonas triclosanedens]MCP8463233.1 cupin domain-containing protein [Pseudomonas triclosanedens]MCP8469708.1 cupin domain-containing protein [Pseudomonas triclosanedens]MCP8474034.1 cupin domain-containing protein [Pseudomonas triclosanedens]WAI48568.1 cupin domain-containing protein [Pseudomonas triclosanedens]
MHPRARYLIDTLGLTPHPEGGFYRRVFESALADANGRQQSSAIFFLLPGGTVSRWHRVDADELWHYHEGGPLELLVAQTPDAVRRELLGAVAEGSLPQRAVPAHAWQAARCLGDYVLVGCTVSPAFDFAGFRLLADDAQAQRDWPRLAGEFPDLL